MYNIIGWIGFSLLSIGLWYIGKKKRWAFIFTAVGEVFIFEYSMSIKAWSIAAIGMLFTVLAIRNYILWAGPSKKTHVSLEKDGRTYIFTNSGSKVDLIDPKPETILIEDVAHHLARLCRFTGACSEFYSVAEHCVRAAQKAPRDRALDILMHDCEEYAFNDLSRPCKYLVGMEAYRDRGTHLKVVMGKKFGFNPKKDELVDLLDNRMYTTEVRDLMNRESQMIVDYPTFLEKIIPWTPLDAEEAFLKEFYNLTLPEEN